MAQASGVEKARFESLDGGGTFTVQFNPKELKLDEKASWKASDEHGEDEPHLTYEKGEPTALTMELIFDTSDTKENVNTKFIVPLRGFMTAQYEDAEAKDATGAEHQSPEENLPTSDEGDEKPTRTVARVRRRTSPQPAPPKQRDAGTPPQVPSSADGGTPKPFRWKSLEP